MTREEFTASQLTTNQAAQIVLTEEIQHSISKCAKGYLQSECVRALLQNKEFTLPYLEDAPESANNLITRLFDTLESTPYCLAGRRIAEARKVAYSLQARL